MAWSVPLTAVSNATLTAAQWNASVRDNLLETAASKVTAAGQYVVGTAANALAVRVPTGAGVSNTETTTSTSYTTLATIGPVVSSVTTGTQAFVSIGARMSNDTANSESWASFAISGATTVAASDNFALLYRAAAINAPHRASACLIVTGLTPGSNTFTMQYRVGGATGTFSNRQLAVIPF